MLAAAVGFFISVSLLIFNDHTWFNPAETDPPAWHEVFRLLAGPITAGLVCLITLPADWGPDGWWAALAISLLPADHQPADLRHRPDHGRAAPRWSRRSRTPAASW